MPDIRIWQVFLLSLVVLWLGILVGVWTRSTREHLVESESKIITVLEGALLTLFGLLMGFTFSMAVTRYDMRKLLVVTEANTIGTTWLRTAALAEPVRTEEQNLLRQYVRERLIFQGEVHNPGELAETQEKIDRLQGQLWAAASGYAIDHRDPVTSLYLQTLNQTIDVAGERVAADENRIPLEAWVILLFVGFVATIVVGTKIGRDRWLLQSILPIVLAATLAMTMDLDSPRYGFIRVTQAAMERVAQDMTRLPQQAP
jgi:hypothetical protein